MKVSHNKLGEIGEQAVANHFKRKGYVLRGTNYRKKWGEIDLILEKEGIIHFVEVKTVSSRSSVSHETWLPEENVSYHKLDKLFRTIETWILEFSYEGEWQLDVAAVWLDTEKGTGSIKVIENIIKDT